MFLRDVCILCIIGGNKKQEVRTVFQGFSDASVDFLWGIRFNNERTWFMAHKQEYLTYVYRPMKELADEVYGRFMERHRDLGLDLDRRVCRIYRDARRLHGRGPYKDRLWWTMERPVEHWVGQPVYWFELAPEGYSYGMGYWSAAPLTMAKFRARLDRDPKPFERLVHMFVEQDVFTLCGEDYKRPRQTKNGLLAQWYRKKSFSLACECPLDERLYTPALVDDLCDGFSALLPFYQYLIRLEGDPDPRG